MAEASRPLAERMRPRSLDDMVGQRRLLAPQSALRRAVEHGPKEAIFAAPQHPYTQALLAAAPSVNGHKTDLQLKGELPSPLNPPSGCRFHTRCPHVMPVCRERAPPLTEPAPGHQVACHLIQS